MPRHIQDKIRYVSILFIISMVLFALWLASVLNTGTSFQNTARSNPLAMIHSLFPWFWVLLSTFLLLIIAVFRLEGEPKWLHALLLCQLSIFLYFTPFILSGFSWSPDSLWHGGIAAYMPEILDGSELVYSTYARSYPLSFMTTYLTEQVTGITVLPYTLYLYPLFSIITITLLAYGFSTRLLGPKRAFMAMLMALPALHFIEPHVSPFATGTIFVLLSFVLLTIQGRAAKVLNFFVIVTLTLTHPISPISLGIFLFSVMLVKRLFKRLRYESEFIVTSDFGFHFLFLGLVWLSWTIYHSMSIYKTIEYAIIDLVSLRFLNRLLYVSEWTAGGQGFIYPEIHQLNLQIYAIYLFVASILVIRSLRQDTRLHENLVLPISAVAYAAFGYMLFLATSQRFLLGRGLIFYIIMGSMCVAAYLMRRDHRHGVFEESIVVVFVLFLLFTFPIISYSKEAYNTFTPSSGSGLEFVTSRIDLSGKSISMGNDQQLAAYANVSKGILLEKYPPVLNKTSADFIVLRINLFFVRAMRIDLSFTDNGYTRLEEGLRRDVGYNKIYCSPTFKVYSSNEDRQP